MTDLRRIASEYRRALWFLAVALLVNVLLWAAVVRPLGERVRSGEQAAGAATRELVAARKAHDAARATVAGKQQAEEELRRFYEEVLPQDQSGARRMLNVPLLELARNTNVETGRRRFDPDQDRETGLSKLTTTLYLEGEYTNLRRFIHELETAPEFIVLESVIVTQEGEDDEQSLLLTARVATYYRGAANGN